MGAELATGEKPAPPSQVIGQVALGAASAQLPASNNRLPLLV